MSYRYRSGLGVVEYIIITCVVLWIAVSINQAAIGAGARVVDGSLLGSLALRPNHLPQQFWTVLTAMFVHEPFTAGGSGITHILFNMITLYFFGSFLVNIVGDRAFLLIFLVGGIAGNLLYLAVGSGAPVIGASGAIFAAGGALAVLRPRSAVYVFPIPVPIPLWIAVLGGFLLTFAATGIAWQAHLGGLVAGLVTGLIFRQRATGRWF